MGHGPADANSLSRASRLDDERIKAGRTLGDDYFDELLARIRDIRSSERMFYQKILGHLRHEHRLRSDGGTLTQLFFRPCRTRCTGLPTGTPLPRCAPRADAAQPHMGLTTWKNGLTGPIRKSDVAIAKNYLHHEEIEALNLIVSAYLEFAELQAKAGGRCTWPIGSRSSMISCGSRIRTFSFTLAASAIKTPNGTHIDSSILRNRAPTPRGHTTDHRF